MPALPGIPRIANATPALLSAFAGLNMVQAAFTGFCPAAMVFKRLGLKPGLLFK